MGTRCRICSSPASLFGEGLVLAKHRVRYDRCDACGFIQTEEPYWLEESYAEAITRSDIGLVGRNLQMSGIARQLILLCFDPGGRFVDYGGGYGMFVRLMRDQGFDFYRQDPLCQNLFAYGFEASPEVKYDLLTAWEVFEHLADPLHGIAQMLSYSENILFSTQLLAAPAPQLDQWWYYGLEHGQHVSFYSRKTLEVIAHHFSLNLSFTDGWVHLLTRHPVSPLRMRFFLNDRWGWMRRWLSRPQPPSLLAKDFAAITHQELK